MTTSHKRGYPGSFEGERLANYFNSPRVSEQVMNLFLGLAEALQFGRDFSLWVRKPQLQVGDVRRVIVLERESPISPLGYHVTEGRTAKEEIEKHWKQPDLRQWKALWKKVARTLRRYSFVAELDEGLEVHPARRGSFHWRSRNGQGGVAVLWMLELLKIGRLDRVRRCLRCSKWFFSAVKKEGKFCSIECQRASYRSKDENREQHREYMRSWRDQKEQEKGHRS